MLRRDLSWQVLHALESTFSKVLEDFLMAFQRQEYPNPERINSTHPEAQAFQSPGGLFDRKNVLRSVYDLDFRGGHNTSPNVPYHVFQDVF
jgi:hypothetical protein